MLCPVRGYGIGAATPSGNPHLLRHLLLFKKDQLSKAPHFTPRLFCVVIGHVCEKARALDWVDGSASASAHTHQCSIASEEIDAPLAPVVRIKNGQRELIELRWGVIPIWAKDTKIAYKTINARAETVATAPALLPGCRTGDRVAFSGADGDRN
jgi:hypothetical protein